MFGLADEVGGQVGGVGGVVGDDADLGGAVLPVDADLALQDALGGGDVHVAGAGDHVDGRALTGAVGEHGERLRAAGRVHLGDAEQGAGGQHRRVRQAAELALRGTRDRDLADSGRLGRDHVHHHGRRVGDEAAWHVDAGPVDGDEAGGDGEARRGRGVRAARDLGLVHHPGAAGGFLEGVPDLGVDGVQGMLQGFSRDAGMRQVHAVEPPGVLTDRRAAADADVLGDRLYQVHGAIHVEGRARQHAVERLPGEPVRGVTTQVNNGGDGADPAIRSHPPSLRRPQAGRRTVRMLDSRVPHVPASSTAAESSVLG